MPYLVDTGPPSQLNRKFSWERDYDETQEINRPEVNEWTLESLSSSKVEAVELNGPFSNANKSWPPKIRRKPGSFSSDSSRISDNSFSGTSPPSSRSSSVSPPVARISPPTPPPPLPDRLPPPPPRGYPVRPSHTGDRSARADSSTSFKNNQPQQKSLPPATNPQLTSEVPVVRSPKKSRRFTFDLSSHNRHHDRPQSALSPVLDVPAPILPPPVPPKIPLESKSMPRRYTAVLEFEPPSRNPSDSFIGTTAVEQVSPTTARRGPRNVSFSLPSPVRNSQALPKRYRQTSLPPEIPATPMKPAATSPVTSPVTKPPIRQWPTHPDYHGGYEAGHEFAVPSTPPASQDAGLQSPKYRPPISPRTDRPLPLRIETDFPPVEPLKPSTSPLHLNSRPSKGTRAERRKVLSPAEVQSAAEELSDLVDFYLEEFIASATTRGVMSPTLGEYLKSPVSEESVEIVEQEIPATVSLEGRKRVRFVSMVRRALRSDD